jgi:hypothetical protein
VWWSEIHPVESLVTGVTNQQYYFKEIMSEAKPSIQSIPEPNVLRNNVEACYRYFLAKDAYIEAHLAAVTDNDTAPKSHKFFKGGNKIRDTVRKQLSYCDLSCLTDPPDTLVKLFRRNPSNDTM